MKSETIIVSDIKLFSKKIALGAYTFSRKNKLPWVAIQSTVRDIKNRKLQNRGVQRNLRYVVCSHLRPNPDPNPNPRVEINRKTKVNHSPRKFDGFGSFFLNTA